MFQRYHTFLMVLLPFLELKTKMNIYFSPEFHRTTIILPIASEITMLTYLIHSNVLIIYRLFYTQKSICEIQSIFYGIQRADETENVLKYFE